MKKKLEIEKQILEIELFECMTPLSFAKIQEQLEIINFEIESIL